MSFKKKFIEWYGGTDKVIHTLVSVLFVLVSYSLSINFIRFIDLTVKDHLTISISITLLIGIVNEVLDSKEKMNKFDLSDMAANAVGIIIASLYIVYGL